MGFSICFYVERMVNGAWQWVPGGEHVTRHSPEFVPHLGGRNVFAALVGDPCMAAIGDTVQPIGERAVGDPPPDASPEVAADLARLEDAHCGIGWHALSTLLAYDWKANHADMMAVIDRMKALGDPDAVRCIFALIH